MRQSATAASQLVARRRVLAALQVLERGLVGSDQARLRSGLDRHVAHRHAALHRQRPDGRTPVLDDVADAAARADLAEDREDDVLRRRALGQFAVDGDRHPLRSFLRQRLGGEHVLDLARADAERDRPERAVRGGVRVAAHDGHARHRAALLGADHVDDALARVTHREVDDAELGGVRPQRVDLLGRDRVGDRLVDVGRRHVVVFGGDRQVGAAHATARQPEAVEGLGAGHLVHEVEVDVQQVGFAGCGVHDVSVPDLLRQCLRLGDVSAMCVLLVCSGSCRVPTIGIGFLRYGHRNGRWRTRQGDDDSRRDRIRAAIARRTADRHRAAPGDRPPPRRRARNARAAAARRRRALRARSTPRHPRPGRGRALRAHRSGDAGAARRCATPPARACSCSFAKATPAAA